MSSGPIGFMRVGARFLSLGARMGYQGDAGNAACLIKSMKALLGLAAVALLGAAAETLDFCVDDGRRGRRSPARVRSSPRLVVRRRGLPARADVGERRFARAWTDGRSWGDAAATFRLINTYMRRQAGVCPRGSARSASRRTPTRDKLLAKFTGYGCFLYVDNDGMAASGGGTLGSCAATTTATRCLPSPTPCGGATCGPTSPCARSAARSCAYVPSDGAAATEIAADDATYASGGVGGNAHRQNGGGRAIGTSSASRSTSSRRRRGRTPRPRARGGHAGADAAADAGADAAARADADAAADGRRRPGCGICAVVAAVAAHTAALWRVRRRARDRGRVRGRGHRAQPVARRAARPGGASSISRARTLHRAAIIIATTRSLTGRRATASFKTPKFACRAPRRPGPPTTRRRTRRRSRPTTTGARGFPEESGPRRRALKAWSKPRDMRTSEAASLASC